MLQDYYSIESFYVNHKIKCNIPFPGNTVKEDIC